MLHLLARTRSQALPFGSCVQPSSTDITMSDRQLAAIAVCPDGASGALLSVTLVSGPTNEAVLADPGEHKLQAHTPDDVASAVSRIVADIAASTTAIALSLPVALTWHHKDRYNDAIGNVPGAGIWRTFSHSNACLRHFADDFRADEVVDVLFLDLTPRPRCCATFSVEADAGGGVCFSASMAQPTIVETSATSPPEDLIDKLVTPTIDPSTHPDLHGVYIFRPGGSCAALSSALQSYFPDTPIKWVSLSEISRSAATLIHQDLGGPRDREILCALVLPVPIKIALADGRLVPAVPRNYFLPLIRTVVFTTSRDDQATATLRFVNGTKPFGAVVVEGLAAGRPKGAARIQVCVEMDHDGETSVCVEEVGCGVKMVANLGNVLDAMTRADIDAYLAEHCDESDELDSWPPRADVLGDLPA